MDEFTGMAWVVFFISALLIGVSKTGVPGVGILAIVLTIFEMEAKASVGLILPLLITGDIVAVLYYRRHAVWSHILRLLPWALVGIAIGFVLLGQVDDAQLARIIGVIVLTLVAVDYWRNKRADQAKIPTQLWFAALVGILAGITTMVGNAAGPLIIIYFLAMRLDKNEFMGTGAWYFIVLNCVKVPLLTYLGMITWQSFRIDLVLIPAVLAGAAVGIVVLKRIPQKWFVVAVKLLTVAASIRLILS